MVPIVEHDEVSRRRSSPPEKIHAGDHETAPTGFALANDCSSPPWNASVVVAGSARSSLASTAAAAREERAQAAAERREYRTVNRARATVAGVSTVFQSQPGWSPKTSTRNRSGHGNGCGLASEGRLRSAARRQPGSPGGPCNRRRSIATAQALIAVSGRHGWSGVEPHARDGRQSVLDPIECRTRTAARAPQHLRHRDGRAGNDWLPARPHRLSHQRGIGWQEPSR